MKETTDLKEQLKYAQKKNKSMKKKLKLKTNLLLEVLIDRKKPLCTCVNLTNQNLFLN